MRNALRGLVAIAAVLLTVPGALARAQAASFITITSVGSPADNVGLLTITAEAPSDISGLTAYITNSLGTPVLTVTDFTLASGTSMDGTWTVASPVTERQLKLGTYSVKVEATDTGGQTVTTPYNWQFAFVVEPTITLTASTNVISYDSQDVTFSGTVTGLWPDGSVKPLGGKTLSLYDPDSEARPVTTASDGTYSLTFVPLPVGTYYLELPASSTTASARSPQADITADVYPVSLTAHLNTSQADLGQTVTVSGSVTYQPGATWQPLANSPVDIYTGRWPNPYGNEVGSGTTGADGTFSIQVPAGTGPFEVYAGAVPYDPSVDPFFAQQEETLPLTVALPVEITQFTGSLSRYRRVSVSGCLIEMYASAQSPVPLSLEYSAGPSGPWTSLTTINPATGQACVNGYGLPFSGHVTAPAAAGYYRVVHAPTPQYQRAVSTVVYLHREPTKITAFSVSTRRVRRGRYIRVSGRLWHRGSSWRHYAYKRVVIRCRYRDRWHAFAFRPRTNGSGWFSARFRAYHSGAWDAQYRGNRRTFASVSRRIWVRVVR